MSGRATHGDRRPLRTWHGALGAGLILLVIWAQSIVPLAALRMATEAAPAGLSAICGHTAEASAVEDPAPLAPGCHACPLCASGLAAPVVPALPQAGRPLRWSPIAWPTPPPAGTPHHARIAGRPRAPPTPL